MIARYWKAIVAALAPVFLVIQSATTDGVITHDEWVAIGTAAAAAVLVWLVPNKQPVVKPSNDQTERPYRR
jgi:hypothetical protein